MSRGSMDCFGDFDKVSEKCDKCKVNIICIMKTLESETCMKNFPFDNNENFNCPPTCSITDKSKCEIARKITAESCDPDTDCFSEYGKDVNKCLLCEKAPQCEIYSISKKNLSLSIREITDSNEDQIRDLDTDSGSCYRYHTFEKDCYSECDFMIRCRRATGIIPGNTCKYWVEDIETDYEDGTRMCNKYDVCPSAEYCFNTLEKLVNKIREEEKKFKAFRNFLSLKEVREAMEVK